MLINKNDTFWRPFAIIYAFAVQWRHMIKFEGIDTVLRATYILRVLVLEGTRENSRILDKQKHIVTMLLYEI